MPQPEIKNTNRKQKSAEAASMIPIVIKPKYLALLRDIGDPERLANYAVESYLVTRILKYIEECKTEIKNYEKKYGCTYQEFYDRIVDLNDKDSTFIKHIEEQNPTYEDDFITWGAFQRELKKWNDEMKSILMS